MYCTTATQVYLFVAVIKAAGPTRPSLPPSGSPASSSSNSIQADVQPAAKPKGQPPPIPSRVKEQPPSETSSVQATLSTEASTVQTINGPNDNTHSNSSGRLPPPVPSRQLDNIKAVASVPTSTANSCDVTAQDSTANSSSASDSTANITKSKPTPPPIPQRRLL